MPEHMTRTYIYPPLNRFSHGQAGSNLVVITRHYHIAWTGEKGQGLEGYGFNLFLNTTREIIQQEIPVAVYGEELGFRV